jgi:hypothetical protein
MVTYSMKHKTELVNVIRTSRFLEPESEGCVAPILAETRRIIRTENAFSII